MFRDGQYLEVIKASDTCLATAVVTVQEKTIKIKKKEVSTNKWLDLEDWAALYKILERAILRNVRAEGSSRDLENCKWKKSTRQLEVTYTFEPSGSAKDVTSLPTIRVNVSPAKKKSEKTEVCGSTLEKGATRDRALEKSRNDAYDRAHQEYYGNASPSKAEDNDIVAEISKETRNNRNKRYLQLDGSEHSALEEYVPDAPVAKKLCTHFKYIPSRKSTLERLQVSSNEYSPMVSDNKSVTEVIRYIPNSVDSSQVSYETYEPSARSIVNIPKEYVPTSKGTNKASFEEYQPDFTTKSMKFDNSYVPSSVRLTNENSRKSVEKARRQQSEKHSSRRRESSTKGNIDLFT